MSRLAELVLAIWWESQEMRASLHRVCQVRACDTRVVAGGIEIGARRRGPQTSRMSTPLLIAGECVCRDYLCDLVVEADRFLASSGDGLVNPLGAVRAHLRKRGPGDWSRRRRTEQGAQARTDRIRSSVRAQGLPDEFHRALLEFLVQEAGSLAPLADDAALHRRLCELLAAEFSGTPEEYQARVIQGLRVVEAACRQGRRVPAGPGLSTELITWWERYVERPLGRRSRLGIESLSSALLDAARPPEAHLACPIAEAEFERVLDTVATRTDPVMSHGTDPGVIVLAVLRNALAAAPDRLANPVETVRTATVELVRCGILPEHIAESFLADHRRVQEAARQLLVITAAAA